MSAIAEKGGGTFQGIKLVLCENPLSPIDDAIAAAQAEVPQSNYCVESVIESDLSEVPNETLVRILGVLHFVAKRWSRGGREYLEVINQYVGARIAKGVRVRRSV